jgi:hypothetical protein
LSALTYNGVTLSYLSTSGPAFLPVMDEVAGVDYVATKVVIVCTCNITPGAPPALPGETATQTMARVSHLLNTPRRGLIFSVGGQTLVSVVAPNGNTTIPLRDVRNGPFAFARVDRIIGTETLVVQFRVETYVVDCAEASGAPLYLSHRWTEVADVNQFGMGRRARTGRIEVRADMLANADQLRGLVVPPLEPDWVRVGSQYTLQGDGRVLAYVHTDEEQYLMPPNPAAKAEGRFTISSKDGASYWAECVLRLQGGKPTDKAILMRRAVSIALAKLQSANPPNKNGSFPIFGSLSEDMFANDVTVRLTAQVMPNRTRLSSQSTLNSSGSPPPQDQGATTTTPAVKSNGKAPGISANALDWLKVPQEYFAGAPGQFDPGDRGSGQLLLVAAALQDPCLRQSIVTSTYQQQSMSPGPGQTVPASITIAATVPDDSESFRANDEPDGVYEHYEVNVMNVEDRNIFALPVGKKDADAAVIQTAAPVARRRVEWKAHKIGGPPRVPKPELKDTNWVLTKAQIDPEQVEPIADGSVLRFCVAGCCDYVALSAKKANLTLSFTTNPSLTAAVPPWVDQVAGQYAVAPLIFADDIVEPKGSSFSTGGGIIPGVNG